MLFSSQNELRVTPAAPERRHAALELALASLPAAERQGLIAAAEAATAQAAAALTTAAAGDASGGGLRDPDLEGLFTACRRERLVGAVWGQLQPGRTASVWPPQTVPGEAEVGQRLMEVLIGFLSRRQVRLAQSLLLTDGGDDAERLRQAGFRRAADLLYLVSLAAKFPSAPPASHLQFTSLTPENQRRFESLVETTYIDSLDCTALNDVRQIDDVMAGYRATGVFDPSRWLLVEHQRNEVGCLLLTDYPDLDQWELVYMGLAPDARGKGWGLDVVRHAQWLARQAGRGRLVLAVDAANAPAIAVYAAAGFTAWDRRSVFLRVVAPAGETPPEERSGIRENSER